jgi:gas vesicle protein GvpL/GvpF
MGNTKAPVATGTYLYCITPASPLTGARRHLPARSRGQGGAEVRIVACDDLAAVVSDAPAGCCEVSRENLLAHERVIEDVLSRTDVLPARFGTVAESDTAICERLLRRQRDDLCAELARVRGCVELTLMALWERDRLFAEIVGEDDQIRALRDEIAALPDAASYFQRITLGQLTDAAIHERREREADTLLAAIEPHARETRQNRNFTDMMILNVALLVPREHVSAFDTLVSALRQEYAGRLVFRYAGPLPPYNFVAIAPSEEV